MNIHIFHKWNKWESYNQNFTVTFGRIMPKSVQGKTQCVIERWQRRTCEVCGKTQEEEVRGS